MTRNVSAADDSTPPLSVSAMTATADRFRGLAVWLVVISSIVAIALTVGLRVNVTASGTFVIDWVLAALLLASRIWWDRSGHHKVADAAGTVAVASLGAMACGAIAMLELRLNFPIADAMLHRVDLALGMDGVRVATIVAQHRDALIPILALVYNNTLQLFFGSLILLSLTKDRVEAWRAAFIFIGTLLTTCAVAAFIPATGLINWAPPSVLTFLPQAFMSHFEEFYYGVHPLLRLQVIDGVITFPSFHAVVGFLVFSMWRKRTVTLVAAAIWLAVELLSTVTGGHYVIDLIGGFVVWAAWFAVSRLIERRIAESSQHGAPTQLDGVVSPSPLLAAPR
jgi:PAP2 superfamily